MLVCINPKEYNLTKYKAYEAIDNIENRVIIRNDTRKKASYSKDLFRDIKTLSKEDISKIEIGSTRLVYLLNGDVFRVNNDVELESIGMFLTNYTFAHRLGICSNDEKRPKPVRKLIKEIKKNKNIIFNDHPYSILSKNGKDKVILYSRQNRGQKRVLINEILNNEKCYEG